MIDFFQKGATMTKRITGTAKLKGAPEIHARQRRSICGVASFMNEGTPIVRILLEIADTEESRKRGLMGREKIPNVCGMMFDGLTDSGYFWMKDCRFPIDVVFMDKSGTITKMYQMPVDPEGRKHYPYDAEDVAAIEMAGGFIAAHQIKVGFTVDVKRINQEVQHG